jgi:hypothetical protein
MTCAFAYVHVHVVKYCVPQSENGIQALHI